MKFRKFIIPFLFFIFFLALGQQLYKLFLLWQQSLFFDFKVYWDGIKAALAGGNIYYPDGVYQNPTPFNYPPTTLLFLLILPIFSKSVAALLLLFLSLGSLLATIYLLVKMNFKKDNLIFFLFFSILFIQYFPTKFTLTLGQINLLILFLMTLSFYLFKIKKNHLSGIFLGIATLIKIFPGFLIFFFIKEKRYKTILSFIITGFLGILATFLIFKPVLLFNYFGQVGTGLFFNAGEVSYFDQSLNSFLLRLDFTSFWRLFLRLAVTLISLAVFLRKKDKALGFFGLMFSIMIFLPSFAWFHHYVILIPVFIILFAKIFQKKELWPKIILFLAFLLVSFHFRYPEIPESSGFLVASHPFIGALILWIYSLRRN